MTRIKPGEIRQAQRFGHELIGLPDVVEDHGQQLWQLLLDQRLNLGRCQPQGMDKPDSAIDPEAWRQSAAEHYGAMLDKVIASDGEAFERRLELLRDAEADIAIEQQADAEERARW